MAMVKGKVEAVSTKFDKYSVLVNDTWYATKMEWAKVKPNKGDIIMFDDKGGKFLTKVKVLDEASPGSAPSAGGGRYSDNLGVELGHASNIAIRGMAQIDPETLVPFSKDWYQVFVKETENIYKIMKGLRNKYSGQPVVEVKSEAKEPEEEKEVTPEVTEEDLF